MSSPVIGVLALQGAFAKHMAMLKMIGAHAVEVRRPSELAGCSGLIIPGGESTTIFTHMRFIEFSDPFKEFAKTHPVFGTCAGLILMADKIKGDTMQPFRLLDIEVERNAFGRQIESFETEIDFRSPTAKSHAQKLPAVFIRAPRIIKVGKDVQVLASYKGEPVLVQQGHFLGATFHPELSGDPSIHLHFLHLVSKT